jgi:hypothetical protein
MTVRKRHLGPVRDHVQSAEQELGKIDARRQKDVAELQEKILAEIADIEPKLKKKSGLLDGLKKLVGELDRYKGIGAEEVLSRDIADALDKLEYAYEIAADNLYMDPGERVENAITKMIGEELGGENGQVKMIDGVAMVPVKLVQDTITNARKQ